MSIIPTQELVLWHCIMTVDMTILGISLLTDIIQRQDSKKPKIGHSEQSVAVILLYLFEAGRFTSW